MLLVVYLFFKTKIIPSSLVQPECVKQLPKVTQKKTSVKKQEQLNDDLLQVSQWAENWLVKFNAAKSKALTVTLKTKNTHNLDLPLH